MFSFTRRIIFGQGDKASDLNVSCHRFSPGFMYFIYVGRGARIRKSSCGVLEFYDKYATYKSYLLTRRESTYGMNPGKGWKAFFSSIA